VLAAARDGCAVCDGWKKRMGQSVRERVTSVEQERTRYDTSNRRLPPPPMLATRQHAGRHVPQTGLCRGSAGSTAGARPRSPTPTTRRLPGRNRSRPWVSWELRRRGKRKSRHGTCSIGLRLYTHALPHPDLDCLYMYMFIGPNLGLYSHRRRHELVSFPPLVYLRAAAIAQNGLFVALSNGKLKASYSPGRATGDCSPELPSQC